MLPRRRIDWSVILARGRAPGAASAPAWGEHAAPSDIAGLLHACDDLFSIRDADALLKRAVGLALEVVGLVRAGIYLYDEPLGLMLGTWGTDLERAIVDEHHAMFQLGPDGRHVFERAVSGGAHWTLVEDCPIITLDAQETRIVGRGWVVCTPICSAGGPLGMLYNDAGLTEARVDEGKQARAAILCALVGSLLAALRRAQPPVSAASPSEPVAERTFSSKLVEPRSDKTVSMGTLMPGPASAAVPCPEPGMAVSPRMSRK